MAIVLPLLAVMTHELSLDWSAMVQVRPVAELSESRLKTSHATMSAALPEPVADELDVDRLDDDDDELDDVDDDDDCPQNESTWAAALARLESFSKELALLLLIAFLAASTSFWASAFTSLGAFFT